MRKFVHKRSSIIFLLVGLLVACSDQSDEIQPNTNTGGPPAVNDWLIPPAEVLDGGPGKDGIPSIDNPQFSDVSDITFLQDNDLVIGVKIGNDIRVYPHPVLDWHEIVNDKVADIPLAITYCPLTGTAIGWRREVAGAETNFGVSGLLYNANLMPYDRVTDSRWSQMLLKSVNGSQAGVEVETYPLLETTWSTWKRLYPQSQVLNLNTGFSRNYGSYPYGDYRTNDELLIFPVSNDDDRLPRKDRGLGVLVNDKAKFYPIDSFAQGPIEVIQETIQGVELVIIGSQTQNFIVAFERRLPDGTLLNLEGLDNAASDAVVKDQEGNEWNLFGEAVQGPRIGAKLFAPTSFIGYWFAWGTFYRQSDIYGQ
ncbi:MAG TPA: DUF3179 domain-containing protein [Saprospiraceae bacterium]|nr:DUF3179 domain-containing protein [Saprospiraceae bacterium]HMQ84722.1 DUF3179 domain-containing protein [Saprospiraceae bacterium]